MDRRADRRTAGDEQVESVARERPRADSQGGAQPCRALRASGVHTGRRRGQCRPGAQSQHSQWWARAAGAASRPLAERRPGMEGAGRDVRGRAGRHRARALELELGVPGRRGTESLPARGPWTRSQKAFSATPMKLVARQRYSPPSRSDTLARRRRASASTFSLIQDCGDKRPCSGTPRGSPAGHQAGGRTGSATGRGGDWVVHPQGCLEETLRHQGQLHRMRLLHDQPHSPSPDPLAVHLPWPGGLAGPGTHTLPGAHGEHATPRAAVPALWTLEPVLLPVPPRPRRPPCL